MQHYRYQDGFEGYLCALSRCLSDGTDQAGFLRGTTEVEPGLFQAMTIEVETDRLTAMQFREKFIVATSREAFATARFAFHSQREGVEMILWRYFRLGFKAGKKIKNMLADRDVNSIDRLARGVAHEAHKYKGFVRFREVRQGFLYARIEPQADILVFLAQHFAERVSDRPWMIHDPGRSQAVVYDLKQWRFLQGVEASGEPEYSESEEDCSNLWRHYFNRLAIPERHNPRLQQQHVPLRARKYLVEFETETKPAADNNIEVKQPSLTAQLPRP
jgi:probable DNA metabolism protein